MARKTFVKRHLRRTIRGGLTPVQWHERRLKARRLVAKSMDEESMISDAESAKERRELKAAMRKDWRAAIELVGADTADTMSINEAFEPLEE